MGEFVATCMFLMMTIGTVTNTATDDNGTHGLASGRHFMIAFTFGVSIFMLVYVFASVSGGHINPAVSFMLLLTSKITPLRFVVYVIAQCLGAMSGVAIVKSWSAEAFDRVGGACNAVSPGYTKGAAFSIEVFTTMILLFAVSTAVDKKQDSVNNNPRQGATHVAGLAPLAIGFSVFLAHCISITVTNTSINPARSFGTAAVFGAPCWDDHWIFWVGPMFASICVAIVYECIIKDKRVFVLVDPAAEEGVINEKLE